MGISVEHKPFEILDCTLRDGGYYTNWDFDKNLVHTYISSFNKLPINYIELGYRSNPMKEYLGEFFYCPLYVLEELKELSKSKLAIILNEKDVRQEHLDSLLKPCIGIIDLVRIAVDPKSFSRALQLAEKIKSLGFLVGFNVMYMSTWREEKKFLGEIKYVDPVADYFYLVDSYGGVYPNDVKDTLDLVKANVTCKIGFHGHNNLELALINSLTAVECGAGIIDSTITGMGRGAGNLKTELLLTALNAKFNFKVDFNALSKVVDVFEKLQRIHEWGTNLPYMVSGANSLPQKDVMEWVTKRFYSFNSIIRALQNQKEGVEDNEKLPFFNHNKTYKTAIIIGGGPNAADHAKAVSEFIKQLTSVCIVHASSKNAKWYKEIGVDQFFCLVGNEGYRLETVFSEFGPLKAYCVLPPYPRKMGTYIPDHAKNSSYELKEVLFTDKLHDSHTALALQTALDLGTEKIYMIGYDGYFEETISQKERGLSEENEFLFDAFEKFKGVKLIALTPTNYKNLGTTSIYSYL